MKRTKIIATVGPATNSKESIKSMIENGANGLRLNFSHGTHDERHEQIRWIREAASELDTSVAIVQDLQGPKIRLGDFEGEIKIEKGVEIRLKSGANYTESGIIPLQYDIYPRVEVGQRLYIFDGKVKTRIIKKEDGFIVAMPENSGVVIKRKGINLPDTNFTGEVITQKDMTDIEFGSTVDLDYVALSFVNSSSDVKDLRKILSELGSNAKIIAKIETIPALEDIESIIKASDMIMIARGDMAVEAGAEVVPIEQRRIIGLCRKYATPAIVATQMLASMVNMTEPSRAEVSDVATAVIMGTDCIMLSDETANGNYPQEAVIAMAKIAQYAEENTIPDNLLQDNVDTNNLQESICSAAIRIANDINADAIIANTETGASALHVAARRPETSIFAVTYTQRVANLLALVCGVRSVVHTENTGMEQLSQYVKDASLIQEGSRVVVVSGSKAGEIGGTDTIRVRTV